jgi:hypothetical protein
LLPAVLEAGLVAMKYFALILFLLMPPLGALAQSALEGASDQQLGNLETRLDNIMQQLQQEAPAAASQNDVCDAFIEQLIEMGFDENRDTASCNSRGRGRCSATVNGVQINECPQGKFARGRGRKREVSWGGRPLQDRDNTSIEIEEVPIGQTL